MMPRMDTKLAALLDTLRAGLEAAPEETREIAIGALWEVSNLLNDATRLPGERERVLDLLWDVGRDDKELAERLRRTHGYLAEQLDGRAERVRARPAIADGIVVQVRDALRSMDRSLAGVTEDEVRQETADPRRGASAVLAHFCCRYARRLHPNFRRENREAVKFIDGIVRAPARKLK